MNLDPRYRNYWLDLSRKEKEVKETERKKSIATILAMLGQMSKKPKGTKNKP